jgi:hypothetical protein
MIMVQDKEEQKKLLAEIMEADDKDGLYEQQTDNILTYGQLVKWTLEIKTRGGFLWRLWFLISAPIIWLIKGEVKIK